MHTGKYPYENLLKEKASEFINYLSRKNILADIKPGSEREYSVKIDVKEYGILNLYYKPSQKTFTMTFQEILNQNKSGKMKMYWDEMNGVVRDENIYSDRGYEIDVDGSYRNGVTSYGAVIRKDGKKIKELSGIVDSGLVKGSYQVAGEIKAVTESVNWCMENNVNEVSIYYDYKGLEKWAIGKWKTKKEVSKEYSDFMKSVNIKIKWVKIESHTGKKWNEYADKLAGRAADAGK